MGLIWLNLVLYSLLSHGVSEGHSYFIFPFFSFLGLGRFRGYVVERRITWSERNAHCSCFYQGALLEGYETNLQAEIAPGGISG